jgi:hypothetical protein
MYKKRRQRKLDRYKAEARARRAIAVDTQSELGTRRASKINDEIAGRAAVLRSYASSGTRC